MNKSVVVVLVVGVICLVGAPLGGLMALGAMLSSTTSAQPEYECNTGATIIHASGNGEVRLPVTGTYTVTSPFGMRNHPRLGITRLHAGLDLAMSPTGGPVVAPMAGTVQSVNPNVPGAGNFIVLSHGDGLTTRYLHLASMSVTPGQKVKIGQEIGREGNTTGGTDISTGAHLHFEVIKNGTATDPVPWLEQHGISVPAVGSSGTAGSGSASSATDASPDSGTSSSSATQVKVGGFELPEPDGAGRHTPGTKPLPIPEAHMRAFKSAEKKYGIPWQWLAGHSMEETHHWKIKAVSSAGAMGPMQFTPPTWIDYGVDGDGDGKAEILDVEDSIHSAANMLAKNGGTTSAEGVRSAIRRYNNADWYVNDVLWYAHQYADGKVSVTSAGAAGGGDDCSQAGIVQAAAPGDCPSSGSPAEQGLTPAALTVLRCGAEQAEWVETMHGVGERPIADDHPDGRAVDFMVPDYTSTQGNERGWQLAKWMRANAEQLGIAYVIFDQKIWHRSRDAQGWRPMGDRGSPTADHKDHVHVSVVDSTSADPKPSGATARGDVPSSGGGRYES